MSNYTKCCVYCGNFDCAAGAAKCQNQKWNHWNKINQSPAFFVGFDDYATAFPAAYECSDFLDKTALFVKSTNENRCLCPGGYWRVLVVEQYKQEKWYIIVADFDDGAIEKEFLSFDDVEAEINRLKDMAPFDMADLISFGYSY